MKSFDFKALKPLLLVLLVLGGTVPARANEVPQGANDLVDFGASRCRLIGGGCLNEEGGAGHRRSTFGGSVRSARDPDGAEAHTWQHVYRDGRTLLLDFKSEDARLVHCRPVPARGCPSRSMNVRADIEGTGSAKRGADGALVDANFQAEIVDQREGVCGGQRDLYSITIRAGHWIGRGAVLFEMSGEIDCGNLQIHGFQAGSP